MVAALRRWNASDRETIDCRHEIALLMESFLCAAFRISPDGRQRDWWSDGVLCVDVEFASASEIHIAGAAIWSDGRAEKGFFLGPFEVELHFHAPTDDCYARAIVHFGKLDADGRIIRRSVDASPTMTMVRRPRENSRWAMAMEITGY